MIPSRISGGRNNLMKRWFVVLLLVPVFASFAFAQTGTKKRRPLPYEYGGVVIGNSSSNAGLSPVQFDHWLHRAKYTCRLCHVDIGFAMKVNATGIKAADNMKGYYCGTCHNGKMALGDRRIFEACATKYTKEDSKRCNRCHSRGETVKREYDFASFIEKFPKERFGNGVDWEKAEETGLIKPIDSIEGISVKRPPLATQKDFTIAAKVETMPEIIFSHKKHTVWNGCELCHPEIFPSIRKGATKYSMTDIFEGKYCGACHMSVAFPTTDCQRCHTKPVR
jgi:c(7)-type cytochrome triheme protein